MNPHLQLLLKHSWWPATVVGLTAFTADPILATEMKIPRMEIAVSAATVQQIGGFVGQRIQANRENYLKRFDIDRYVEMVRQRNHTDWGWIGEQDGKWLESAILASGQAGDADLRQKARSVLAGIIATQEPDGYVGITPKTVRTPAQPLRGMDPYELYFTLHALITAHEQWGDAASLTAARKLGDYFVEHIGPGKAEFWPSPYRSPENVRKIICEQLTTVPEGTARAPTLYIRSEIAGHTAHYGWEGTLLIDPMLRLYQVSGDLRYLDWSHWVIGNIDRWSGWDSFSKLDLVAQGKLGIHEVQPYVHVHTFQMNFLGFLRMYEITGDVSYLHKVVGAYDDVVRRQLYMTGGVSVREHYEPGLFKPITGDVVETCANMSWLELNQQLLELTGQTRYADLIEKLLWNHIFAAQTVDGDSSRYHTPPNGEKPRNCFHGPDCCTASGHRLVAKLPSVIYATGNNGIYINQFVASAANMNLRDGTPVTLRQETSYPESERVAIRVELDKPARFALHIRLPAWCETPTARLNTEALADLRPGSYLVLDRTWKSGDVLELRFPMALHWVQSDGGERQPPAPLGERRWALLRGPVVYAVDTVLATGPETSSLRVGDDIGVEPAKEPAYPQAALPQGALGPGFSVPVRTADKRDVTMTFWPFANVGAWYRPGEKKPDPNSAAFHYAAWLLDRHSQKFADQAASVTTDQANKDAVDAVLIGDPSSGVIGITHGENDASQRVSLTGADWRIHEDADGKGVERGMPQADPCDPGWIPANVPGNIQADVEAARLIKPISYGAGDPRLAQIAEKDWWYRKDFSVPDSFAGKRVRLVFDGVDQDCEIWLNGKRLGRNSGMFRRFGFDVAALLQPGKPNRLAVKIDRMPPPVAQAMLGADRHDDTCRDIDTMIHHLHELKSPTNAAYDWSIAVYTLGIWKDVRLEASGPARIEWTQVRTELQNNHSMASVRVRLDVDSLAGMKARASLRVSGQSADVTKWVAINLTAGGNIVEAELDVASPALWWPNGQGQQPLYALQASLLTETGGILDSRKVRFGIREIRWAQDAEAATRAPYSLGNSLQLVVNGRPVRQMGSNILPPDMLFGRILQRGPRLIQLAKAVGMNTLRVWGGGVILPDEMYDLADELGIMLISEFPMANFRPPTDPVFLANLETTARDCVRQVRNHPSIVEWNAGNEIIWDKNHPAIPILDKVVREEDGRIFRIDDDGGHYHPFGATDGPALYQYFDAVLPSLYGRSSQRMSEFSVSSPTNLEVWHRLIPPASQWPLNNPNDPILFRKKAYGMFTPQTWLNKHLTDQRFGSLDSLSCVIQAGQFLGAESLRYAIDALRRKGTALPGGFMSWVYNEPWPNAAGANMVDYDGRTLMNYDFFKQALAPLSLSLKYDSMLYDPALGVKAGLWISSDAPTATGGLKWQWLARDRRGQVFARDHGTTAIEPQEAKQLGMLELKPPAKTGLGPLLIEMQLHDAAGKLLVERLHVFGPATAKDPLGGLLRNAVPDDDADPLKEGPPEVCRPVRRTSLQVKALPMRMEAGQEVLELQVQNTGAMTALFCEPQPLIEYRTDLFIDNNHCFIPPGESRTLTIKAADKPRGGLSLAATGWRITTWNADDLVVEPGSDVLLAVGRRDQMCREYLGYFDTSKIKDTKETTLAGTRPDPSQAPYMLDGNHALRCEFPLSDAQAKQAARLRIHTADQAETTPTKVAITINGRRMEKSLPLGLGIQRTDPAHLAFPATVEFEVPAADLRPGKNTLEVRVQDDGWFSWDALDITTNKSGESTNDR